MRHSSVCLRETDKVSTGNYRVSFVSGKRVDISSVMGRDRSPTCFRTFRRGVILTCPRRAVKLDLVEPFLCIAVFRIRCLHELDEMGQSEMINLLSEQTLCGK